MFIELTKVALYEGASCLFTMITLQFRGQLNIIEVIVPSVKLNNYLVK